MTRIVAVKIAVQEHFHAFIRPGAQASRKRRAGNDRAIAPMVGHDKHRHPVTDVRPKQVGQTIDLALEPRRDIVDRREDEPGAHAPVITRLPKRRVAGR